MRLGPASSPRRSASYSLRSWKQKWTSERPSQYACEQEKQFPTGLVGDQQLGTNRRVAVDADLRVELLAEALDPVIRATPLPDGERGSHGVVEHEVWPIPGTDRWYAGPQDEAPVHHLAECPLHHARVDGSVELDRTNKVGGTSLL